MTNHTQKNKEYVNSVLEYLKESRERLATAECSYCTRDASQFAFFDQRNFVPVQGKVDERGNQAYAIYGDCCLNDARKIEDIKRAFVIDSRGNAGYVPLYTLQDIDEPEEDSRIEEIRKTNESKDSSKNVSVQKDTATAKVETGTIRRPIESENKSIPSDEANKSVGSQIVDKAEKDATDTKEDKEPSLLEKLKFKKNE